jgi:hypothetical protein
MRWSGTTRIALSVARVTSLTVLLLVPATRALAQPVPVLLLPATRASTQPVPVLLLPDTRASTQPVPVLLLPDTRASVQPVAAPPGQYSTPRLVLGGTAAGAAGMVAFGIAGGLVGGGICRDYGNPDSCRGLEGVLWGAAVGYTVGIPVGVHLANGRSGKLSTSMLASAAIAGAGVAVGLGSGSDAALAAAAFTAPIAQFVSSVMLERATAQRRAR